MISATLLALLCQDQAIPDVVERVGPAVVSIYMTREDSSPDRGIPGHRLRQRGLGSGVLVSPDGHVLTNNHVVERASDVRVVLADRREFKARILGTEKKTDLALLRVDGQDLPFVPWGDSSKVRVGETVVAIGNPFGFGQTASHGIVTAKGRANVGMVDYEDFLQTDAAVNPGNSGGALVNLRGELVGVPTAIASRTGVFLGIGFAIPSNMARDVMELLKRHGKVSRAQMGVVTQDMTPSLARAMDGAPDRGALVVDVRVGGPAHAAGVKPGDILRALNGEDVESSSWLRNRIALKTDGEAVKLEVWREGKASEVEVKLRSEEGEAPARRIEERDLPGAKEEESGLTGITVAPATPSLLRRLGLPRDLRGLVITKIDASRVSPWVGLREGDVILEVNRKPVETAEALKKEIQADAGDAVLLTVRRGQAGLFVAVPRETAR